LEFSAGLNILTGDNGQGKTSVLEALVIGMTSRSFRTEQSKDVIAYGTDEAAVLLDIDDSGLSRTQRVVLGRSRKSLQICDKRVAKVADFALQTPVVVFHPSDLELVSGPAALRRTLLDRVSLYLVPASFESRKAYQQALRERQKLLNESGVHAKGLEVYEQLASEQGALVAAAHAEAASRLLLAVQPIADTLTSEHVRFRAHYEALGTTDPTAFRQALVERRVRDLAMGRPSYGPQRDDLRLYLDEAEARKHASQGQQRLFALALKLAELSSIRDCRGKDPVLLLDDVASELDPHRTGAVLEWISRIRSQVFVTTTRWTPSNEALFPDLPRRKFWVRDGVAEQES
jgi:DNA replication and repair protein RecF